MNFHKASTLDRLLPLLDGLGPWQRYAIWVGNGILDVYLTDGIACQWRVPREAAFLLQLPSVVERLRWEELIKEHGWQRVGITDSGFTRYSWKSHTALIATWPGEAISRQARWYEEACFHAERISLKNGRPLSLFSPVYLLATTLEQIPTHDVDLRYSEAFARIAYLFAGRTELLDEINDGYYEVRRFVRSALQRLLTYRDLDEALMHVLPAEEWFLSELVRERMENATRDYALG